MEIETQPTTFHLGQTVISRNAMERLHPEDVQLALRRHARGDWGDLSAEDMAKNELSVKEGFRLLSAYRDRHQTRFWIITEASREVTTVLLPEDY